MAAPREIAELVERFERNLEDYRSGRYKETQLRLEFIDPFFEALGWDGACAPRARQRSRGQTGRLTNWPMSCMG